MTALAEALCTLRHRLASSKHEHVTVADDTLLSAAATALYYLDVHHYSFDETTRLTLLPPGVTCIYHCNANTSGGGIMGLFQELAACHRLLAYRRLGLM
jgi:hypothetical protein